MHLKSINIATSLLHFEKFRHEINRTARLEIRDFWNFNLKYNSFLSLYYMDLWIFVISNEHNISLQKGWGSHDSIFYIVLWFITKNPMRMTLAYFACGKWCFLVTTRGCFLRISKPYLAEIKLLALNYTAN